MKAKRQGPHKSYCGSRELWEKHEGSSPLSRPDLAKMLRLRSLPPHLLLSHSVSKVFFFVYLSPERSC